jgi:hypothetical protein
MSRRKPKPKAKRAYYVPSFRDKAELILRLIWSVVMQFSWPVKIAILALPVAGYFAYPYYEQWQIWDEVFDTQVFNMNDEIMGGFRTLQYDNMVRIGAARIHPNGMSEAREDYTNTPRVRVFWDFATENHAHTSLKNLSQRTCYFKTLDLPERKKGQKVLVIGIYDRDTLRVRWTTPGDVVGEIGFGEYPAGEAWQHGIVPLSDNWRKDAPNNWPEKTSWNEAVDGPKVDAAGAGAWITVKADYSEPCKEANYE